MKSLLTVIAVLLTLQACQKNEEAVGLQIEGFSPAAGSPGDIVVITGQGFNPTTLENTITIGDASTKASIATATRLLFVIPEGASPAPLVVATGGQSASSGQQFGLIPIIYEFNPAAQLPGDTVVITGTGFNFDRTKNIVRIGSTQAQVVSVFQEFVSDKNVLRMRILVPNVQSEERKRPITVEQAGQIGASLDSLTVRVLTLLGVTPTSQEVGKTVTLTGLDFSPYAGENVVSFTNDTGRIQATVTSASTEQLTVIVPPGAKTGKIYLTVNGTTVEEDFEVK